MVSNHLPTGMILQAKRAFAPDTSYEYDSKKRFQKSTFSSPTQKTDIVFHHVFHVFTPLKNLVRFWMSKIQKSKKKNKKETKPSQEFHCHLPVDLPVPQDGVGNQWS